MKVSNLLNTFPLSLQIYDCLDLGRRIDVNWPSDEMRACGGRSSWRDWTPQVGMIGYVVHYWQPNHPDVFYRSNVNRTLLLLQIGKHFVPVGENGVKEYNSPGSETRAQTVSAENLHGLSRRGRNSNRSRKFSDSIRKLKSEEDPVMPVVVVLPEEERCESGKDEERESPLGEVAAETLAEAQCEIEEVKKSNESKDVANVETVTEVAVAVDHLTEDVVQGESIASSLSTTNNNIDEELASVRE